MSYSVELDIKADKKYNIIDIIEQLKKINFSNKVPVFDHLNRTIVGFIKDVGLKKCLKAEFNPNLNIIDYINDNYIYFNIENQNFILENSKN